MGVASLERWHWVLIALLVGWTGGLLWRHASDFEDELDGYGNLMVDQRTFENALVSEVDGHRLFRDVTVYPYHLPDRHGGHRLVHIVSGWYWNGRPEIENGQLAARYVRTCFLAGVPYVPRSGTPTGGKDSTVRDYLRALRASDGVQFRYAWWWWARTPTFGWLALSLILIGGVWPTLVNLIAFGTWRRPVDAPTFSLWALGRYHSATPKPSPAASPPSAPGAFPDDDHADLTTPGAALADAPAQLARRLETARLQQVAAAEAEAKEFGAGATDFYPTELHPTERPSPEVR